MSLMRSSCHCGAVELEFKLAEPLSEARRCDCSLCRRKGAAMISAVVGDLTVLRGEDKLTLYSFNTHTAKHWFCSVCGIYTHHQRRSNPGEYGLNVGCIHGIDPRTSETVLWFDGVNHPADQD